MAMAIISIALSIFLTIQVEREPTSSPLGITNEIRSPNRLHSQLDRIRREYASQIITAVADNNELEGTQKITLLLEYLDLSRTDFAESDYAIACDVFRHLLSRSISLDNESDGMELLSVLVLFDSWSQSQLSMSGSDLPVQLDSSGFESQEAYAEYVMEFELRSSLIRRKQQLSSLRQRYLSVISSAANAFDLSDSLANKIRAIEP